MQILVGQANFAISRAKQVVDSGKYDPELIKMGIEKGELARESMEKWVNATEKVRSKAKCQRQVVTKSSTKMSKMEKQKAQAWARIKANVWITKKTAEKRGSLPKSLSKGGPGEKNAGEHKEGEDSLKMRGISKAQARGPKRVREVKKMHEKEGGAKLNKYKRTKTEGHDGTMEAPKDMVSEGVMAVEVPVRNNSFINPQGFAQLFEGTSATIQILMP